MRHTPTPRMIACLLCLTWTLSTRAEVVVIVHPDSPVQTMTPRQVSDIYLGRSRFIGTHQQEPSRPTSVYEQPANSPLREAFFRSLNGMTLSQLNAYWARLRFSGEVLPPIALADSKAVVEAVRGNRHAIGYVDASTISGAAVKIVLHLND